MSIGPWDFTGFDIVVLLVLLISLLMAASRGLMRELTSIMALLIATVTALFIYGRFRFAAQDFISPSWLADGALGLGAFFLVYLLLVFALSGIVKQLKGKNVGFIDRLLGAGFGVVRGLIVASLGTLVISQLMGSTSDTPEGEDGRTADIQKLPPDFVKDSTFYPVLGRIGNTIMSLPFAKIKDSATKLKDGDLDGAVEEIQ